MAYYLPDGSKLFMSTAMSAAKNITVFTNANPGRATVVAHGWASNDEVLISSGWADLADTVGQITVASVDTFDLKNFDTSNTTNFPAGSGTGTAKKVTTWIELPQLTNAQRSGGDPKEVIVAPMAQRNEISLFAGFSASKQNLEFAYDPSLPGIQALLATSQTQTPAAFKWVVPGGVSIYCYGKIAVNEQPELTKGKVISINGVLTAMGRILWST